MVSKTIQLVKTSTSNNTFTIIAFSYSAISLSVSESTMKNIMIKENTSPTANLEHIIKPL